jgi:hypothetical protein
MSQIEDEIAAFEALKEDLEADHLGEWALVHHGALISLFPTFEAAAAYAVEQFGRGPFLIRRIGSEPLTLPASVMYRPYAG